jgi:hypothetical protein
VFPHYGGYSSCIPGKAKCELGGFSQSSDFHHYQGSCVGLVAFWGVVAQAPMFGAGGGPTTCFVRKGRCSE